MLLLSKPADDTAKDVPQTPIRGSKRGPALLLPNREANTNRWISDAPDSPAFRTLNGFVPRVPSRAPSCMVRQMSEAPLIRGRDFHGQQLCTTNSNDTSKDNNASGRVGKPLSDIPTTSILAKIHRSASQCHLATPSLSILPAYAAAELVLTLRL